MSRTCWLLGAALMLWGPVAMAQAPEEYRDMAPTEYRNLPRGIGAVVDATKVPEAPKYWLGIEVLPVPPALREHLNLPEKQGLLVQGVAADSPAAKAGIVQHDVLLRVGDKPLREPHDLILAIEATKEGKLKIDLIHGGKPNTVEAAPAKRPAELRGPAGEASADDWQTMEKWMEGMWPNGGVEGQRPPLRFRIFHPGAIVPHDVVVSPPLPPNMSITISKEGDQPAKIVVKRGDEKWELTEKQLDKLPADVRPHVERMLGRGALGIIGGLGSVDVLPEIAPPDRAGPSSSATEGRLEKRFDEMSRRIDKLLQSMEEPADGHHPSPEKPAEKPAEK
jgi:hypothetical protein